MGGEFDFSLGPVITGAVTLTAALAWNEAAKTGIETLYPQPTGKSFKASLMYALIVTIVVIVIFMVMKTIQTAAKAKKNSDGALSMPSIGFW